MSQCSQSVTSLKTSLSDWLSYLESIHPSAIDMGLERVRKVAEAMAMDFTGSTVITVAGTNGKGTTCRLLETLLLDQGKSVGVYSSPHLIDYRERVRMNDGLLSEQAFCDAFDAVEQARGETTLTYFEFGTLAALWMFNEHQPEVILLEVGLGGRLDATNIISPDLAVITTIDLDHQDWLGDTRDAIAREKAGIMRQNGLAVIGEHEPPTSLQHVVDSLQVDASWALNDFKVSQQADRWGWSMDTVSLHDLPIPQIPLQNAATALAALYKLGWLQDTASLRRVIASTGLPGRCQRVAVSPEVVVDVAHNPQATRALRAWLEAQPSAPLHIVVGMLKDKAVVESLLPMADITANWYAAGIAGPRGRDAKSMADALRESGVTAIEECDTVTTAYQCAQQNSQPTDRILVFGSFLTVADVLALHSDNKGFRK